MPYAYRFSNLLGTVYRSGNVAWSTDGTTLFSPVGNRVSAFALAEHTSSTLDFETRSDVDRIAVSPDGALLLAVDVDGYALAVSLSRGVVVHRFNFKARVRDVVFSPNGLFLAVAHGSHLSVWRTPGLARDFSPFSLHRRFTGHFNDVTCVSWSPNGAYLVTGSKDLTARIYSLNPTPGFVPVTLSGHRERVVAVHFADEDTVYTVSRDGGVFVWLWTERPELSVRALLGDGELSDDDGDEGDIDAAESATGVGDGGGICGAPRRGGMKRARALDGDDHAWNAAARVSAQGATAPLASRVRHAVPAPIAAQTDASALDARSVARGEWTLSNKHFFRNEDHARVMSAALHRKSGLLVAGFSNGSFALYALPAFEPVHSLSISAHEVHSCAVNPSGDWLAFGSRTLGQLLVWEWRSESYVLRQQGHFYDLNTAAYSPNGQLLVTGGDDGKVKVWNAATGFCFVTFAEHKAPVSAVAFVGGEGSGHGLAVLSASLDGTVRAYDLVRYRNFKTLTTPPDAPRVQFSCLAADEAGEVVCAGALEPFNIYVWSLQTGRLLDVLTGHEAPITSLAYSSAAGLLASGSWDKTLRLWDVFRTGTATETFIHGSDVLAVAFRPDGAQVAATTLAGEIAFWDIKVGAQTGLIDARQDVAGGRSVGDLSGAKAAAAARHISSIAYTADGEAVLAGGRSKWVCLYAVTARILLRRYQLSHNRSLDGLLDKIDTRTPTAGGVERALGDFDDDDDDGGMERGAAARDVLPGTVRGSAARVDRTARTEARAKCVVFSPTGRAFGVATTEGLLLYSLDDALLFNPIELGSDTTPAAALAALSRGFFARALLIALHVGEPALIMHALEAAPRDTISLIAQAVPLAFLVRLLDLTSARLMPAGAADSAAEAPTTAVVLGPRMSLPKGSPHIELYMTWALALLGVHSRALRERRGYFSGSLLALQRAMLTQRDTLGRLAESNKFALAFATRGAHSRVDLITEGVKEAPVAATGDDDSVNEDAGGDSDAWLGPAS